MRPWATISLLWIDGAHAKPLGHHTAPSGEWIPSLLPLSCFISLIAHYIQEDAIVLKDVFSACLAECRAPVRANVGKFSCLAC